jgi:hypothetical protein
MTKVNFPGRVKVGSSAGAGQAANVISTTSVVTRKIKFPKKAGATNINSIKEGKKQKRAT